MTKARDIMTGGTECIGAEETVLDTARKMKDLGVGALPIPRVRDEWGARYMPAARGTEDRSAQRVPWAVVRRLVWALRWIGSRSRGAAVLPMDSMSRGRHGWTRT